MIEISILGCLDKELPPWLGGRYDSGHNLIEEIVKGGGKAVLAGHAQVINSLGEDVTVLNFLVELLGFV